MKAPAGKRYFQHTKLPDIIGAYPFRSGLSEAQLAHETERREAFLDFLMGVLVRPLALFGSSSDTCKLCPWRSVEVQEDTRAAGIAMLSAYGGIRWNSEAKYSSCL